MLYHVSVAMDFSDEHLIVGHILPVPATGSSTVTTPATATADGFACVPCDEIRNNTGNSTEEHSGATNSNPNSNINSQVDSSNEVCSSVRQVLNTIPEHTETAHDSRNAKSSESESSVITQRKTVPSSENALVEESSSISTGSPRHLHTQEKNENSSCESWSRDHRHHHDE